MPKLTAQQLEQAQESKTCDNCHKQISIDDEFYVVEHAQARKDVPQGFKTRERVYYILCSSWCLYAWATKNHARK